MVKPAKNTICLWYDDDAENAARFYAKTFPDSFVGAVHRARSVRRHWMCADGRPLPGCLT
jgi:predicted 3-demethylubiquinone-9 3-methyltransferase (glyoxalase superfamily)